MAQAPRRAPDVLPLSEVFPSAGRRLLRGIGVSDHLAPRQQKLLDWYLALPYEVQVELQKHTNGIPGAEIERLYIQHVQKRSALDGLGDTTKSELA